MIVLVNVLEMTDNGAQLTGKTDQSEGIPGAGTLEQVI